MALIVHQHEGSDFNYYNKQDITIIDPRGNETVVTVGGKTSAVYKAQIDQIIQPWEKASLLQQKNAGLIDSRIRERGFLEWDSYDILFDPSEVATQEQRDLAMGAVKEWAMNSEIPGKEGKRLAAIQEWHDDGNTPHIRVDVHRAPWADEKTVNNFTNTSSGEKNNDRSNLVNKLEAVGFITQIAGPNANANVNRSSYQQQPFSQNTPPQNTQQTPPSNTPQNPQQQTTSTPNTQQATTQNAPQQPSGNNQRIPFNLMNRPPAGYKEIFDQLQARKEEQARINGEVDFLERTVSALQTHQAVVTENGDLKTQVDDLTIEKAQLEQALNDANIIITNKEIENQRLDTEKSDLIVKNGELQNNIVELNSSLETLNAEYETINEELTTANSSIVELKTLHEADQETIAQLQRELEALRSNNVVLAQEKDAINKQNNALEQANNALSTNNTELKEENKVLSDDITTLKDRITTLESNLDEMRSKLDEQTKEQDRLLDTWKRVSMGYRNLTKETYTKENLDSVNTFLNDVMKRVETLELDIKQNERELRSTREQYEERISMMKESHATQVETLKETISVLRDSSRAERPAQSVEQVANQPKEQTSGLQQADESLLDNSNHIAREIKTMEDEQQKNKHKDDPTIK